MIINVFQVAIVIFLKLELAKFNSTMLVIASVIQAEQLRL